MNNSSDRNPIKMDFETLRGGVLLCGRYKLKARVPRWIGKRRFQAYDQKTEEDRMLIFLDATVAGRMSPELVGKMGSEHAGLLRVLSLEEFYGIHFFVVPWVDAEPLENYVQQEGAMNRLQTARILEAISAALEEARGAGLPAQRLSAGSILLSGNEDSGAARPFFFPINLIDPTEETLGSDVTGIARALLRVVPADGQVSRGAVTLPLDLVEAFAEAEKLEAAEAFDLLIEQLRKPMRTTLPVRRKTASELPMQLPEKRDIEEAAFYNERNLEESDRRHHRRKRRSGNRESEKKNTGTVSKLAAWLGVVVALLVSAIACAATYLIVLPIYTPVQAKSARSVLHESAGGEAAPRDGESKPSASEQLSLAIAEARSLQSYGSGQASLEAWRDILKNNPHNVKVIEGATGAIEALEEDRGNIENGYRPNIIAVLEELSEMQVPAANYMLARVFWSSDPEIATAHLVEAARAAYEPAQSWCREQRIKYSQ
ncbi:MAG: hypothetical protein ACK5LK_06700 [Chthoniobacterales bacterium]